MMIKNALVPVLLLSAFLAGAQTADPVLSGGSPAPGNTGVFAPFVSQFQAEAKNGFIRLSWIDSPDIRGPVFIYRSTSPFTGNTAPAMSTTSEVPYGVQSYVEEADTTGVLYYFIAASDDRGRKYALVIPFTNTTVVSLDETSVSEYFRPPSPARPEIQETPLAARLDRDRVIVSFSGETGKNAVLYRSTVPIRGKEDLLAAVIVQQGTVSPFVDYPVPGIPCYYALMYEEDLVSGKAFIRPGTNATMSPVEISLDTPWLSKNGLRTIPLPGLRLDSGSFLPVPVPLGPEAARAASSIAGDGTTGRRVSRTAPEVFAEDLEKPLAGEEYLLRTIVQGSFNAMNWAAAGEEFRRFLSLPRNAQTEARAHFYLGQIQYFNGSPREALFEFLGSQTLYPNETNPWIQTVLAKLAR